MNLTTLVHLLNYGLVLIFGIIASFYLADYPFPAHKRAYCLTIIGFSLMELIFYLILGEVIQMLPIADPFTSHFTDPFRTAPQLFCISHCRIVCLSFMHAPKNVRYPCCIFL